MEENSHEPARKLIAIGGSAGSLDIVLELLPKIKPGAFLSIVIIFHRKSGFDSSLLQLLSARTGLEVREPEDKENIESGVIYLAPADYHLLIELNKTFSLDFSEKVNYSRPSIDVTFETAADAYGKNLSCILLSGANNDGTNGLKYTIEKGGTALVQNPETAGVAFMPEYAISALQIAKTYSPEEIVDYINSVKAD